MCYSGDEDGGVSPGVPPPGPGAASSASAALLQLRPPPPAIPKPPPPRLDSFGHHGAAGPPGHHGAAQPQLHHHHPAAAAAKGSASNRCVMGAQVHWGFRRAGACVRRTVLHRFSAKRSVSDSFGGVCQGFNWTSEPQNLSKCWGASDGCVGNTRVLSA